MISRSIKLLLIVFLAQTAQKGLLANPTSDKWWPVVLVGPPAIHGIRIPYIAAYRYVAGEWQEVVVQIDEVNQRGDYVLEGGLPFTKNTDDGLFDDNDELVVEAGSLGDYFEASQVSDRIRSIGYSFWRLKVKTPLAKTGYLLIVERRTRNPATRQPRVSFDATKQIVKSQRYRYQFHRERAALLGQVFLKTRQGMLALLKDSTFLLSLKLPWYLPNFDLEENEFVSEIESWQVGPIRTLVAVGVKFRNFLKIFDFHMFSELVFYEGAMHIPTIVEFTFDPSRYFQPGTGLAYSIDVADGLNWDLKTNLVPIPATEPDSYVRSGVKAAKFSQFYALGLLPETAVFVRVRVDKKVAKLTPPPFLIQKEDFSNVELQKYWPWLAEIPGDLGAFVDISGVHQGSYDFGLDLILASEAEVKVLADFKSVETDWFLLAPQND